MKRSFISDADLSKVRQRFTELEQDELEFDVVCVECGNDTATEGFTLCTDCLEADLNDRLSSAPAHDMKLKDDEDMTAEEFDAELAAGTPVNLVVVDRVRVVLEDDEDDGRGRE